MSHSVLLEVAISVISIVIPASFLLHIPPIISNHPTTPSRTLTSRLLFKACDQNGRVGVEGFAQQLSGDRSKLEAQCSTFGWPTRLDTGRSSGTLWRVQGHLVEKYLGIKVNFITDCLGENLKDLKVKGSLWNKIQTNLILQTLSCVTSDSLVCHVVSLCLDKGSYDILPACVERSESCKRGRGRGYHLYTAYLYRNILYTFVNTWVYRWIPQYTCMIIVRNILSTWNGFLDLKIFEACFSTSIWVSPETLACHTRKHT